MLDARQRQALQLGGVGGSFCILLMVPVVIMAAAGVAETLIGAAFVEALLLWVVLSGLRNVRRDFEQQRGDTREFLAAHASRGRVAPLGSAV